MKTRMLVLVVLILAVTLFSQGIPYNQEFQVNTSTYGSQKNPKIAVLSNGNFVICWEQNGSEYGVYAQMFNSSGNKVGDEFQVYTNTNGNYLNPDIVPLSNGGFVICSECESQDGSGYDIYVQLFKFDGSKTGDEFQVNTNTNYSRGTKNIEQLSDKIFVICWECESQDGSRFSVYAKLINIDGNKTGDEFRVTNYANSYKGGCDIAALSDSSFVICCESYEEDISDYSIYVQIYNTDGSNVDDEFQVNAYTTGNQLYPEILLLSNGSFVICWSSNDWYGAGSEIYAQLFTSNGNKVGTEFQVNTCTDNNKLGPDLVSLSNGGFVICWSSIGQDGSGHGIYAQLFSSNGSKVGDEFQVNTTTYGNQINTDIVSLSDGGFVICWVSYTPHASNEDVYAQLFTSNGNKVGTEFRVNTYTDGRQYRPDIVALEDRKFAICWNSWGKGQDGSLEGIYAKYYLTEPIIHYLCEYETLNPENAETLQSIYTTFVWQQPSDIRICYPWEIEYDLYLSTDQEFSNPLIYNGIQDTTYILPTTDSLQAGQTYFWKVLAKNIAGDSLWSSNTNAFFVSHTATEVEEEAQLPTGFALEQNYPNPFNPETTVRYSLPKAGVVELKLYDITGREVMSLVNNWQSAGTHSIKVDGRNLASGVYVYTLTAGGYRESKKMALVR